MSQHNVYFMNELMTSIRHGIREGTLDEEEKKWLAPGLRSWDTQKPEELMSTAGTGDAEVTPINEASGTHVNGAGGACVSGVGGARVNRAKEVVLNGHV